MATFKRLLSKSNWPFEAAERMADLMTLLKPDENDSSLIRAIDAFTFLESHLPPITLEQRHRVRLEEWVKEMEGEKHAPTSLDESAFDKIPLLAGFDSRQDMMLFFYGTREPEGDAILSLADKSVQGYIQAAAKRHREFYDPTEQSSGARIRSKSAPPFNLDAVTRMLAESAVQSKLVPPFHQQFALDRLHESLSPRARWRFHRVPKKAPGHLLFRDQIMGPRP